MKKWIKWMLWIFVIAMLISFVLGAFDAVSSWFANLFGISADKVASTSQKVFALSSAATLAVVGVGSFAVAPVLGVGLLVVAALVMFKVIANWVSATPTASGM